MDKMTQNIQEIQGYQKDIQHVYDKVHATKAPDIDFNDVSFRVRNSGRMDSRFGRNTTQEVADHTLRLISTGKEAPDRKKDVEKYLKGLSSSLKKNVTRIQGIQKEMDRLYGDQTPDKLAQYVQDLRGFEHDLRDLYRSIQQGKKTGDDLDDIVSQVLKMGKKHNKMTQDASQNAITDLIQLVKSHDEHIVPRYLMDYFLMMAGKIGFDANDKAELSYGMDH